MRIALLRIKQHRLLGRHEFFLKRFAESLLKAMKSQLQASIQMACLRLIHACGDRKEGRGCCCRRQICFHWRSTDEADVAASQRDAVKAQSSNTNTTEQVGKCILFQRDGHETKSGAFHYTVEYRVQLLPNIHVFRV